MAFATTSIVLSSVSQALITTGTTWANTRGAGPDDTIPVLFFNDSPIRIWIAGSSAQNTTNIGMPVLSSAYFQGDVTASEQLWGITSNGATSTALVHLAAGRQSSAF